MNVEQKPVTASQGPLPGAGPNKTKTDDADGGGFGSVLASLDASDEDDDGAPEKAAEADRDTAAAPAQAQAPTPASLPPLAAGPALAPSGLSAAPSSAGAAAVAAVASDAALPSWAAPMRWLQDSLNPGQRRDAAVAGPAGPSAPGMGEATDALPPEQAAAGRPGAHHGVPGVPGGLPGGPGVSDEPGRAAAAAPAHAWAEQLRAVAGARHALQANAAPDAGAALAPRDASADARPGAQRMPEAAKAELAATAVTLASEQALTAQAVGPVRAEHRTERAADPLTRPAEAAAWNQAGVAAQTGADASAPAAAGAPLDETGRQLAEQVSYWISNDVQNAEIKLDKFGRDPVEVSISLQGTQAHVAFRTDAPEMRQVLQSAAAQLKDMLQGQGLSLAGVSVGASGTGAFQQRAPGDERGVPRQALVAVPQVSAPAAGVRAGQTAGRALDVFV